MSQAVLRKELRQRIREKCEKFSTRVVEWDDSLRSHNLLGADFASLGIDIHWNNYIPSKPSLKQLAVLALDDYKEVLFGGAAGGGKSELLLMSALQYVDVPNYSAIIFRRTLTAAARSGGIMDRAHSWLAATDAVWDNRTNAYLFPSGATLAFGYVDSFDDFQNYQGPEYQFCVAKGTSIPCKRFQNSVVENLNIEDIRAGYLVETLEGWKAVTRTFQPRKKKCVSVGGQVQGTDHKILTAYGWLSYDLLEELSKEFRAWHKSSGVSKESFAKLSQPLSYLRSRLPQAPALSPLDYSDTFRLEKHASSTNSQISVEVSHEKLLETLLLEEWSVPVVRTLPASRSAEFPTDNHLLHDVGEDVLPELEPANSSENYFSYYDQYGGHTRNSLDISREFFLQQADAGTKTRSYQQPDGPGNVRSRSRALLSGYVHPYSLEHRPVSEVVEVVPLSFSLIDDECEVYDLRVEAVSHYIGASRIISVNCGFDELTQFPSGWGEESYRYMFSRLRRLHGVDIPLRVRAACNPGGWGHTWVKQRFDIKKDLVQDSPTYGLFKGNNPERPFVPSYAWDNPYLDVETYVDNLLELDPVTREQLLNGDWSITQEGRFKPAWFKRYSINGPYVVLSPDGRGKANLIHSCRFFITVDPATTDVPTGESLYKNREPSWSVISTWCVVNNRYLLLWHVERFQQEIPEVCKRIRDRYRFWTKGGYQDSAGNSIYIRPEFIGIENNGTNIGVFQICNAMNLPIKPLSPSGSSKLVRSTDAACRAEAGGIFLPATNCHNAGEWLGPFEDEIFRWVGHEHQTADQVDTLSYAAIVMSTEISSTSPVDPEDNEPAQGVVMEASGFLNPSSRILGGYGRDTHGSSGPTNY